MTNCKNCGAPLKSYPCKCEYCGTEYGDKKLDWFFTVNEVRALCGFGPLEDVETSGHRYLESFDLEFGDQKELRRVHDDTFFRC